MSRSHPPISNPRLLLVLLPMLAEGLTNQQMADRLFLSAETVKTRVAVLLKRMGARNRTHAVALAYQRGQLRPPNCACPPLARRADKK